MNSLEKDEMVATVILFALATIAAGFLFHIGWSAFDLMAAVF